MIPAHLQVDLDKKPGQVVNPIVPHPYTRLLTQDQTIEDYITRKYRDEAFVEEASKKKLTFEECLLKMIKEEHPKDVEWWVKNGVECHDDYDFLKKFWKAAQENV